MASFWGNIDNEKAKYNPQENRIAIIILIVGLIVIIASSFIEAIFNFNKKADKNENQTNIVVVDDEWEEL